ncbi:MAG: hypothetical protein EHM72_06935 [Calditrichaeota bacterium]|nr:MAG: hypothetical protein EHM72_06935 [Calditrichota bacterium]
MELLLPLKKRAAAGNPIRIGLVGCGQMGSGLAHTINNITGMSIQAIADIHPQRAIDTLIEMNVNPDDIIITENRGEAEDALFIGKRVVTADALMLPQLDRLEANVEVTGVTDVGARVAWTSINAGKPIIMLNVETDVTIGVYLDRLARKNDAIYTVASGDEPGVLKMLYEQAVLMGFEVICLGKGKNNPIDTTMTPERCREEAISKDMNPKILASFIDGTKTMVEIAAVSNATGLIPDVPGMHGPRVELNDLLTAFRLKKDGGIFSQRGTVDYTTGSIAPGVFAIVYSEDARIQKDMYFITKARGPYYLHFRPYHLCDIETPQSIAEAVLLRERTVTAENMHSEVVCVAKRNLKAGEQVGDIGSADIYGKIYTYHEARTQKAIPLGIAARGKVIIDICAGEMMSENNFLPDSSTFIYELRKKQDVMLEAELSGVSGRS